LCTYRYHHSAVAMEAALRTMIKDALGDFVMKGLDDANISSFPVVLRDMELNAKRLNHEFDPKGEQAIRLTSGTIGNIKVTPRWTGSIEVVASDIQLSFSFSAMQAIRNGAKQAMRSNNDDDLAAAIAASLEEDEQAQQQQQQPKQQQQQQQQPSPQLLQHQLSVREEQHCPQHQHPQSPEPRSGTASHSRSHDAAALMKVWKPVPTTPLEQQQELQTPRQPGHQQRLANSNSSSPCPNYCVAHNSSQKRTKTDDLLTHQCKHCHGLLRSNLKDVQYCQGCSCTLHKCMICGEDAWRPDEDTDATQDILGYTPPHSLSQSAALWLDIQAVFDHRSSGIFDQIFGTGSHGGLFNACTDGSQRHAEEGIVPRAYARLGA